MEWRAVRHNGNRLVNAKPFFCPGVWPFDAVDFVHGSQSSWSFQCLLVSNISYNRIETKQTRYKPSISSISVCFLTNWFLFLSFLDIYCISSYLKVKKKSTFLFFHQTNWRYLFECWKWRWKKGNCWTESKLLLSSTGILLAKTHLLRFVTLQKEIVFFFLKRKSSAALCPIRLDLLLFFFFRRCCCTAGGHFLLARNVISMRKERRGGMCPSAVWLLITKSWSCSSPPGLELKN